ncbi:Metallo-hydrolase/oxidoreductase [Zopfia rhizophila CBS 207.26]|uniref:Metallo-hydrolase/oxidoreductase n=1 Tax=Zopfia rhizophila CBS 207.26 TaxID=1314779 RepID=A0A6A6DJH7_9PEZI|nr:Metallo-hydrolase/oxidoreductase [Zopfia rhizophila CBS 207.26]
MSAIKHISIDPQKSRSPTRDDVELPTALPKAKETKVHPSNTGSGGENASLFFVGTATTILEWESLRILTDPNFLHAGDHVHLGPGVTGTRLTNPAIDLHQLPRIDAIFLSHYHADHFDQEVEAKLCRTIPIITTPHAKSCLTAKGDDSFTEVHALDFFESLVLDVSMNNINGGRKPGVKVTGMPGKHVPPGPLSVANDVLSAVPPTNGWMIELGYMDADNTDKFENGYRIYISGDTLMVDELKEIPERYRSQNIDLMLIHLGGTTIPGPRMPLVMVTMDAKQGMQLIKLINPDLTIPIHYDDYDKAVADAGLNDKVVYLDRKDEYKFKVKQGLQATAKVG